jgi:hypothetical protein
VMPAWTEGRSTHGSTSVRSIRHWLLEHSVASLVSRARCSGDVAYVRSWHKADIAIESQMTACDPKQTCVPKAAYVGNRAPAATFAQT